MKPRRTVSLMTLTAIVLTLSLWLTAGAEQSEDEPRMRATFDLEKIADYVHAVIEADRTLYTTHVVDRMQDLGIVIAAEAWKRRGTLPLPAQMVLEAGDRVEHQGTGLRYRLASLWPIYEENGPANTFEKTGLEVVAKDPREPYTGLIKRGDKRYFKAIYADIAVSKSCVNCHNAHPLSSKRDREVGDVMGGIIISFPVPEE